MITDLTIMLYVADVTKSSDFWQALGFEEALRQDLGGGHLTSLLTYEKTGAALQLYDIEYIRATQPERADKNPVLLFGAEVIDDFYQIAQAVSPVVSDLVSYGINHVFTFEDLDHNVFTVMGERVDVPATAENMAEFDDNVQKLKPLALYALESLREPAYIFFGERSDAWSRYLARQFPPLETSMYFVNTDGTEATHPVRAFYQVETLPTLIKRASTGNFVKFDRKRESLRHFLREE